MKFELFFPIKPFTLAQPFGVNGEFYRANDINIFGHNGWDMIGNDGQICRAAHNGIVTFTGEDGKGGLGIVIRTKDKYLYNNDLVYFKTIYWHLKLGTFKVIAGQEVKVGDILAECDNTGFSSGSHLHFGLKPVKKGEQDWE